MGGKPQVLSALGRLRESRGFSGTASQSGSGGQVVLPNGSTTRSLRLDPDGWLVASPLCGEARPL